MHLKDILEKCDGVIKKEFIARSCITFQPEFKGQCARALREVIHKLAHLLILDTREEMKTIAKEALTQIEKEFDA